MTIPLVGRVSTSLIAGIAKRTPYRIFVAWQLIISPLFLLIIKPVGHSAAHARYIIYCFPLLLVLLVDALLLISGCIAVLIGVKKRSIAFGLIIVLFTAVYWATGFEGLWIDRKLNINHLINKHFIEIDFPVPQFYEDINSEKNFKRVIEFPFFMRFSKRKSAQDMYMRYRQVHRKDVYIGEAVDTGNMNRYVNIFDLPAEMAGESCLVFHKNIRDEIKFWIQPRGSEKEEDNGQFHKVRKQVKPACWFKEKNTIYDMEKILEDLRDLYGPPWRENDMLAIFRILPDNEKPIQK